MDFLKELNDLNESSLGRVYQHFNSDREIGTITAFRGDLPHDENVQRNFQLANKVRSAGYGYIWVDGAWIENEGTPEAQEVSEVSLFIVGRDEQTGLRDHLVQWARDYNQDAFVYKPHGQTDVTYIIDQNDRVIDELRSSRYDDIAEIYTRLRHGSHAGRSFVLEDASVADGFGKKLFDRAKKKVVS